MPSKANKKQQENGKKVPKWIIDHFEQSINAHETLMQIVRISERGIASLQALPGIVQALAHAKGNEDSEMAKNKLALAKADAEISKQEVENDFPLLHNFATVALWSWLENFVKELLVLWLRHHKKSFLVPEMKRVKINVGEYMQLSEQDRIYYIIELLDQELTSTRARGSARFGHLLKPFGISCEIAQESGKALFELHQVRNAIVHKNMSTDKRLKEACPWLKRPRGKQMCVTHEMLFSYSEAVGEFLLETLYAIGDMHGRNLRPTERPPKPDEASSPV